MLRKYYLVKNLVTGEEQIKLRQDFNVNYKWHRQDELIGIKNMLKDFQNGVCKVTQVIS